MLSQGMVLLVGGTMFRPSPLISSRELFGETHSTNVTPNVEVVIRRIFVVALILM